MYEKEDKINLQKIIEEAKNFKYLNLEHGRRRRKISLEISEDTLRSPSPVEERNQTTLQRM